LATQHGQGFGYRIAEEVVRYHAFAALHLAPASHHVTGISDTDQLFDDTSSSAITDDLMVQKILVKLRGTERQRPLLTGLKKALKDLPRAQAFLNRLLDDLDEFGSFQAAR
jgi:5-methylcytosine-specific restriction enzyme B